MSKNNFYKKVIVSVTGVTLLLIGLNQVPKNVINSIPTEVRAAQKAKVIGANSAVYKQTDQKVIKTKKIIRVGEKIRVYGRKTIDGKLYYKIGKKQYIKASNVDGKKLQAAKNTVLYTRSGKVIKNSKILKGQDVKVYGGQVTIKGKKYYSTKYGYIKASALVGMIQPTEPDKEPNEGSTTPSTPASDGLKDKKAAANTEVKKAAEDAVNAIETSPLSADDQMAAIDRVNKIVQTAADTINNAQSEKEITSAQKDAIDACQLEPSKIESTDLATKAGEFVISTAGGDAAKVKAALDKAKEAIVNAKTQAELDKAETDLQNDLNAVVPFAKQQEAAINAIKATTQAAKYKINNNKNLSDDDKATANAIIDTIAEALLSDVQDATKASDLVTAVNTVQAACAQIPTDSESTR